MRYPLYILLLLTIVTGAFFAQGTSAATYLTRISDLLSTSAPGTPTNQTITFTLNQAVPANGAIELRFNEGGFTIPAALNFTDVDVGVSAVAGGPYVQRALSSVQSPGTDDINMTTGASGKIRIDLNTSVGISAGSEIQVKIGTNAVQGSIGDQQMTLSTATTSFPVTIYTYNVADVELDYGRTMIAIIDQVEAGPVDTTDQDPPIILSAVPSGLLQVNTRAVEMYITTNESSVCRWATSSMSYAVMPYLFTSTSTSGFSFSHFSTYSNLEDDTDYDVYIRCVDFRVNEIDPDYLLEFTVGIIPGSASSTATSTGTGTGSGTATTTASSTCTGTNCVGTGTGSGGGPSGSGSGNGPNGGDGAGNGGGGSGESGQGTQLPQADVRIDGWAYPGATVSILRDGVIIGTEAGGGSGEFSNLTEGLDRGVYTFSLYAVDTKGVRSGTYTTTMSLRSSTLNVLSNIMLPPSMSVTDNSVDPGTPLAVTGYSASNAAVTVWLRPRLAQVTTGDVVASTTAAGNGAWALNVPTTGLSVGTYELVAQGKMPGGTVESDKSARKLIGVGVEVGAEAIGDGKGDLNGDGLVNLIDFSILLFNWNTTSVLADINADGTVSLPDFSIMLFNWTG